MRTTMTTRLNCDCCPSEVILCGSTPDKPPGWVTRQVINASWHQYPLTRDVECCSLCANKVLSWVGGKVNAEDPPKLALVVTPTPVAKPATRADAEQILDRLGDEQGLMGRPVFERRLIVLLRGLDGAQTPLILESLAGYLRDQASSMAYDCGLSDKLFLPVITNLEMLATVGRAYRQDEDLDDVADLAASDNEDDDDEDNEDDDDDGVCEICGCPVACECFDDPNDEDNDIDDNA